jgi:hypothetical protein
MATFDAGNERHMELVAQRRMENVQNSAASLKGVAESQARKQAMNRRFAELFEGDEAATAAAVAAELGVTLKDVEASDAFNDAYHGESVEDLKRVYC